MYYVGLGQIRFDFFYQYQTKSRMVSFSFSTPDQSNQTISRFFSQFYLVGRFGLTLWFCLYSPNSGMEDFDVILGMNYFPLIMLFMIVILRMCPQRCLVFRGLSRMVLVVLILESSSPSYVLKNWWREALCLAQTLLGTLVQNHQSGFRSVVWKILDVFPSYFLGFHPGKDIDFVTYLKLVTKHILLLFTLSLQQS